MTTEKRNNIRDIFINLEGTSETVEERTEIFNSMTDDEIERFEVEHLGMQIPTVEELRKQGCKVFINHYRHVKNKGTKSLREWRQLGVKGSEFSPLSGKTTVEIHQPDGVVLKGQSRCSRSDHFVKKAGVAVATYRALL